MSNTDVKRRCFQARKTNRHRTPSAQLEENVRPAEIPARCDTEETRRQDCTLVSRQSCSAVSSPGFLTAPLYGSMP